MASAEQSSSDEAEAPEARPERSARPAGTPSKLETERRVRLKILRQDAPDRPETRRWEQFEVAWQPRMTVSAALLKLDLEPVTSEGRRVAPVAWEAGCLEETCGACTMLIGGRVAQACSALVDELSPRGKPIVLEPLRKFGLVRDLIVDRARAFEALSRVHAWVDFDLERAAAPTPPQAAEEQRSEYALGRCTSCGACLEACPQWSEKRDFVGAAALAQVRRLNLNPVGGLERTERLERVMGPGGVADCGKAQNCVEVCPMQIPLVDGIQGVAREATKRLLFGWLFA
jgi:succinate dehydrogenase / fumarate reductase iron-sulfur subunit